MKTNVEELSGNRVRLDVEVPEADVKHAIEHAASDLAASARIPGFRKGKAPLPLIMARLGRDAVWAEAVRTHLDGWFWTAAATSGVQPVSSPEVELGEDPSDDGSFRFSATVAVLAKPEVPDWTALEVPAAQPEVPAELVDNELDVLRASVAELVPADRPAQEGDTVVVDIEGELAGTQRDYVTEVGSGRLVDGLDEALVGMRAGETKTVSVAVGEGETTEVELALKDVKEPVLPELDDELARSTSEFDTLAELRADVEGRLREHVEAEVEAAFRESAVDALVEATEFDLHPELVDRRAAELWSGMTRSLAQRGLGPEQYLALTGQSQDDLLERLRAEAGHAIKRELALDAVAEKLGLEVTDEEVETFVREQADGAGDDAEETLATLHERGTFESLRGDLRLRKALDEVAAGVQRIPVELAAARDKLWTPEKEKASSGMNIWTPGSEEAPNR
ncbi:MAG TPA: trigger factor [Gaiellaceae bacterium]|nr:trigger factor [Gaiellaceae bacterium]